MVNYDIVKLDSISNELFESAVRPDIHPKSSIYHEAEPSLMQMNEGGYQAEPHLQIGCNEIITCSSMVIKKVIYITLLATIVISITACDIIFRRSIILVAPCWKVQCNRSHPDLTRRS